MQLGHRWLLVWPLYPPQPTPPQPTFTSLSLGAGYWQFAPRSYALCGA